MVECRECGKHRAICSAKKASESELLMLDAHTDAAGNTCGEPLCGADDESELAEQFFVNRALVCYLPLEKIVHGCHLFPSMCSWCATDDQATLVDLESSGMKAKCKGKKAYPICEKCLKDGFAPVTHGASDKTGASYV